MNNELLDLLSSASANYKLARKLAKLTKANDRRAKRITRLENKQVKLTAKARNMEQRLRDNQRIQPVAVTRAIRKYKRISVT